MALSSLMLCACAQLGPRVLKTGRHQYNIAVQQSEGEQLLLNMVRSRYNDPILFLDITSITSGFSRTVNGGLLGVFGSGNSSGEANVGGEFSETPNIFYSPNTGEKFVRQMLTPVDLRTIALLLQAGWSIERVMLLLGESASGLHNRLAPEGANERYGRFLLAAESLRKLQRSGRLSVGFEPGEGEGDEELVLMIRADAIDAPEYQAVCEVLGVGPDGAPIRLRQGFGASADGSTVALATRSLSSAIYHLSRYVDAPPQHVAAGWTTPADDPADPPEDASSSPGQLFRVHSSREDPSRAAVKVFYRDTWFYIEDADQDSKTTFALLSMLITLKSGEPSGTVPLISIPSR